jgi:simple sugar transport system substrate-binding protein
MRRTLLACIFACVVFCISGCSETKGTNLQKTEKPILLGFAQLGSESAWRIGNSQSIKDAANQAGIQLMFENAEQSQGKQIKALRSFIAYQVDVISFSPIVEDGWDNVLREAKDAGIPVLLVDRLIKTDDDSLYVGFVGSDFYQEGRNAGLFLKKKTANMNTVRIVEISGTVDSTPMRQRGKGFRDVLGDDPKYQILESISGDFLRSMGKESMEHLFATYSNIDVLYSHNDAMTLGAIEAIEAKGLIPGKDIIIITVDGEQKAIDLLKEGKINCVVECTPMLGDMVMALAQKLTAGEKIDRITYSSERVFSEYDKDLDILPERGY